MKYILIVISIFCMFCLSFGEFDEKINRKPQNKKDYKYKEKDLKQAKARWISLDEDDWGDDMWQKPIGS